MLGQQIWRLAPKSSISRNISESNSNYLGESGILSNSIVLFIVAYVHHSTVFHLKYSQQTEFCFCISSSEVYYWCLSAINCTGKDMPESLLYALGEADANMYLCSKDLRPSKHRLLFSSYSVTNVHETTGWSKKVRPRRLKAHIFCLRLQNAWTNFHDFWHTSKSFSTEHICWFQIHQIYCSKWCHLAKVNNMSFAFNKRYESSV